MNKIHQYEIKDILASYDIESLAISSGFKRRKSGKITATNFLASFFNLIIAKCYSQRQWAISISSMTNRSISFQAIAKRLNSRSLSFVKAVTTTAIVRNVSLKSYIHQINGLSKFNRVLVEDSTCIKLPSALFNEFPGTANQTSKKVSMARIQLCVDLKNGDHLNYALNSYRDHDGTYASKILGSIKPGDLVIRDLGYSVNSIFDQIGKLDAFYISRFRIRSILYSIDNEELIDLVKVLKGVENKGLSYFESNFIIGGKDRLKCRVICMKLDPEQIKKRKKQNRHNGNRNKNKDHKTIYLNTWNILITNLTNEEYSGEGIYKLYSLRWHIELIFKTWKSYIDVASIFKSCQGPNRVKPEVLLHLCLCFIVVVINPQFKRYQNLIHRRYKRYLSPMKFIKTILNNQINIWNHASDFVLHQVYKNCCYDIRKDRENIYEKIIYL